MARAPGNGRPLWPVDRVWSDALRGRHTLRNVRLRMRLAIVSHVVHYRWGGELFAYAPYAREIEIWADLFEDLLIAAPCRKTVPAGDCALLGRRNISIDPQPEVGGEGLRN